MRIRTALLASISVGSLLLPGAAKSYEPASLCELTRVDGATTNSFTCIACHDGTIGPAAHGRGSADAEDRFGLAAASGGEEQGHPTQVDYERSRVRLSGLTAVAMLPRSIPLPEGKVSCTSCHNGASTEPFHTSMSMRGSALCFACHGDY
jgi:predicted CXXCH cytochrome family protein